MRTIPRMLRSMNEDQATCIAAAIHSSITHISCGAKYPEYMNVCCAIVQITTLQKLQDTVPSAECRWIQINDIPAQETSDLEFTSCCCKAACGVLLSNAWLLPECCPNY